MSENQVNVFGALDSSLYKLAVAAIPESVQITSDMVRGSVNKLVKAWPSTKLTLRTVRLVILWTCVTMLIFRFVLF